MDNVFGEDFGTVIKKIMPKVMLSDAYTFIIISRSIYGGWHVKYADSSQTYVNLVTACKEYDPYTMSFFGVDFSKDASYKEVFHEVLCSRLYLEFSKNQLSGAYRNDMETKEAEAMLNFFRDRGNDLSDKPLKYLTHVEKPLAEFAGMCPYKMATDNNKWTYNKDLAFNAILCIENEYKARLQRLPIESGSGPQPIFMYMFTDNIEKGKFYDPGNIEIISQNNLPQITAKSPDNEKTVCKKPITIQEKLDRAKIQAATQNSAIKGTCGDRPKKRDERE